MRVTITNYKNNEEVSNIEHISDGYAEPSKLKPPIYETGAYKTIADLVDLPQFRGATLSFSDNVIIDITKIATDEERQENEEQRKKRNYLKRKLG